MTSLKYEIRLAYLPIIAMVCIVVAHSIGESKIAWLLSTGFHVHIVIKSVNRNRWVFGVPTRGCAARVGTLQIIGGDAKSSASLHIHVRKIAFSEILKNEL